MTGMIPADIWEQTITLRPIVLAAREEADVLRRLPDTVAAAFAERDIYRLVLPEDLGGRGIDPLAQFDLVEEVSSYDGAVGWNYAIGSNSGSLGGMLATETAREVFAVPGQGMAGSGPPQGRAVAVPGGYRVTGRFAWASGVHQAAWVIGGCMVFDGEERRVGPHGGPVVVHVLARREEITILDRWHVGGMRGTGSTEFEMDGVFVPEQRVFNLYDAKPVHPSPLFRLPSSVFGFALTAVPLGIARSATANLLELASSKTPPPPRVGLAAQPFIQYTVGKTAAMVEGARLAVRDAFTRIWEEVSGGGTSPMASRARLRRASVHAVETSIEAVQMCYRAAGGNALFEDQPFERALRDVNASGGHIVFQRAMMEDCGRVALGLPPLLPVF